MSDPAAVGWFHPDRIPVAVATVLFTAVLLFFLRQARRGRPLFIRRIAGLEAVDEAVGRATEMGRPILYCAGLDPLEEVATVITIGSRFGMISRVSYWPARRATWPRMLMLATVATSSSGSRPAQ